MLLLNAASIPGVTLREDDNGHVQVLDAPAVAEVACSLLARPNHYLSVDEAGYLVICGQVTYRPLRLRAHLSGEFMLICERVR